MRQREEKNRRPEKKLRGFFIFFVIGVGNPNRTRKREEEESVFVFVKEGLSMWKKNSVLD